MCIRDSANWPTHFDFIATEALSHSQDDESWWKHEIVHLIHFLILITHDHVIITWQLDKLGHTHLCTKSLVGGNDTLTLTQFCQTLSKQHRWHWIPPKKKRWMDWELTLPLKPLTGLVSISCSISFLLRISWVLAYHHKHRGEIGENRAYQIGYHLYIYLVLTEMAL